MAGLRTRGTVSGKVQYQGRGMWAELEPLCLTRSSALLTSISGLPQSKPVVPPSLVEMLLGSHKSGECRENMVK